MRVLSFANTAITNTNSPPVACKDKQDGSEARTSERMLHDAGSGLRLLPHAHHDTPPKEPPARFPVSASVNIVPYVITALTTKFFSGTWNHMLTTKKMCMSHERGRLKCDTN